MFLTSTKQGEISGSALGSGGARTVSFAHMLGRAPDSAVIRVLEHDCPALPQFGLLFLGVDRVVWLWANPQPGCTVRFSAKVALAHSSADGPDTDEGILTVDDSVAGAPTRAGVFDVRQFGARGSPIGGPPIDDTVAIRAAIQAAEAAGGGEILLGPGVFSLCVQELTRGNNESCLWLGGSNLWLRGAGKGVTILRCYAPDLGDPKTAWAVYAQAGLPEWQPATVYHAAQRVVRGGEEYQVSSADKGGGGGRLSGVVGPSGRFPGDFSDGSDGLTWRYASHMFVGHGLKIERRSLLDLPLKNTRISDLTIDGLSGLPVGFNVKTDTFPVWTAGGYNEVTTGNAFDSSNEGVRVGGDLIDGILLERVEITGFRGEGFYYGGSTCQRVHMIAPEIHNTIGSMISASAEMLIEDALLYHSGNGFECFHRNMPITVLRANVSDVLIGYADGGNIDLTDFSWGKLTIADSVFDTCYTRGIIVTGYAENIEIRNNEMRDCGITNEDQEFIRVSSFWGPARHVVIADNRLVASLSACKSGISLIGVLQDVEVHDNYIGQSNRGRALGHFIHWPFNILMDGADGAARVRMVRNRWRCDLPINTILASTEEYTGQWIDNVDLGSNDLEYAIQTADGSTDLVLKYSRQLVGGTTDNTYTLVPALKNPQFRIAGEICEISAAGSNVNQNWALIAASSTSHQLTCARYINGKVVLAVMKDGISGKWREHSYVLRATGQGPAANDLEIPSSPIAAMAPIIEAYGCAQVSLMPGAPTEYTDWRNFPPDVPVRVVLGANATVARSGTLALHGGTSVLGPGEVWLVLPAGATAAYELYRSA